MISSLGAVSVLERVGQPVLGVGGRQLAGQLHRRGEVKAVAEFGTEDAQRNGEVSFAHAGRSEQDDVASFGEEAAGGQFLDERPVERGLAGEVEVLQPLGVGQGREAQVGLDDPRLAGGEFGLEEPAQEVGVAPARGGRLLGDGVELGAGRGGPDLCEGFERRVVRRRCSWRAGVFHGLVVVRSW